VIYLKKNYKIRDIHEYRKGKKNNYKCRKVNFFKNKKVNFFLAALFILSICITNVYGYSVISQLKYDIYYLKQDLNKAEILLNQLEVKENTEPISDIEQKIKETLNMDYPKDEQVEYIRID
jgi:cell division protein FtsL